MGHNRCNFKIYNKYNQKILVGNNDFQGIPFSIAMGTGTFFPVTSATNNNNNRYYPDRADPVEDLNEGAKTFVWIQNTFKNYKKFQLVFSADERSGLKSIGDSIAAFRVRVVKDPPGLSVPVGTANPTHSLTITPSAVLGEIIVTTEGPHVLNLTLPTQDSILYVHTEYVDITNVPSSGPPDERVEMHGIRFDLMF